MTKDFRICETIETIKTIGGSAATTEDLLTILIKNREKAKKILNQAPGIFEGSCSYDGLKGIAIKNINDLVYIGLTEKEATTLTAAIELGKRVCRLQENETMHIQTPADAAQYFQTRIKDETHEKFFVMMLNTKNCVIQVKQISEGSLTSSIVHPREIFAPAVVNHAACIVIAHNHPSTNPHPSPEDRNLTNAVEKAGETLGIPLLDHVIIGGNQYYSFKEHGDL